MLRKPLVAVAVLFAALASVVIFAAFYPAERPDHFQDGNVNVEGRLYGPPPSEDAFNATAIQDRLAEPRLRDWYWELGHFYCSRKSPMPPIPAAVHLPPAFVRDLLPGAFAYWMRLGSATYDGIVAGRENEASHAWGELGGFPRDLNGDEWTWADVTMGIAEWTLCPDGHPNPYAGKTYRPGDKPVVERAATSAPESPYHQFADLAARSGIDLGQHPTYTPTYFKDRADKFCKLLRDGSFVAVSQEVTFPPVIRFAETTQDRSRLETAIMRVAASDICPENASNEQDWERANVR